MERSGIVALLETVAALRDPKTGCPWDIEQDHQSITDCLIDECCELLQTIDRGDMEHMEEELGDVLLQVVMHAQIAKEAGHFDFDSVCHEINAKLVRRHPHVFGEGEIKDSEALLEQWEAIKSSEKKRGPAERGRFKDLPRQLPALMFAQDVYKQIVKKEMETGDLLNHEAIAKEAKELDPEAIGARLFEISAACRKHQLDPETLLRRYTQDVVDRLEEE
jgi:XTP/dITP diphosphohydrolase/tetrapyrrole methylase family protein/MazG family protein